MRHSSVTSLVQTIDQLYNHDLDQHHIPGDNPDMIELVLEARVVLDQVIDILKTNPNNTIED